MFAMPNISIQHLSAWEVAVGYLSKPLLSDLSHSRYSVYRSTVVLFLNKKLDTNKNIQGGRLLKRGGKLRCWEQALAVETGICMENLPLGGTHVSAIPEIKPSDLL